MNKVFKILTLIVLCFIFLKCKNIKEAISIKQIEIKKPIITRLTLEDTTILNIKFPNKLIIKNNSFTNKAFVKIEYEYNNIPYDRDYGISLFKKSNKSLKSISTTGKKIIPSKKSLEYIYYTRHFVDSARSIQEQFKPYIEKMLSENKDTLHIGTVKEFKAKHAELFNKLTKNDSISIQFLDGKELGERITVPVKW
ncbi:hypothetical protein [Aquimarina aquimarini]|uniref:hypothetical protein n=1 Tax=Aquimarina aquimarini TaxID=1191734 RepID=UPI001F2364A4|nr:hypothetical protein [Aquimarina aquimarini]